MSNSLNSNASFRLLTTGVVGTAAIVCAVSWPAVLRYAQTQSRELVSLAGATTGPEAGSQLLLASELDPKNDNAIIGLAQFELTAGRADNALRIIDRAGQSRGAIGIRTRALLELNRVNDAVSQTSHLLAENPSDSDLLLAGLTQLVAGRGEGIPQLVARMSSPQASQSLTRADSGKLALAIELNAAGLQKSSSAILASLPVSYERNVLLSTIYLTHDHPDLGAAESLLLAALKDTPSSTWARTELIKIYTVENKSAQLQEQKVLLSRLETSRP